MPEKILAGYLIDGTNSGIDAYLLRVLKAMKGTDAVIDFLTTRETEELRTRVAPFGSRVYEVPSLKSPAAQLRRTRELIRREGYTAAYFNISESFNCMGVIAARQAGCPRVIVHSHSSGPGGGNHQGKRALRKVLNSLFKRPLAGNADLFLACSEEAGRWLYPDSVLRGSAFRVIGNTIDTGRFLYQPGLRKKMREALSLGDALVLGHVGGYHYYKNNLFLFRILEELVRKGSDAILVSVGDGPDFEACRAFAEEHQLTDRVRMLGTRSDVDAILQAMDLYVFPSFYEGQPISVIEAQTSGLPVLMSESVTREVEFFRTDRLSVDESPAVWADRILCLQREYPAKERCSPPQDILENYDSATSERIIRGFLLTEGKRR